MPERIATIIANQKYQSPAFPPLVISESEITTLVSTLLDPEIGNFDEVNHYFEVASTDLTQHLYELFQFRKPYDLLLFYFVGYGILDETGQLFLATNDTALERINETAIAASEISQQMDKSFSRRQVLILDLIFDTNTVPESHFRSEPTWEAIFEGQGYWRTVLSASELIDQTMSGSEYHSIARHSFTEYINRGLQTGDADLSGDGLINIVELHQYLSRELQKTGANHTPRLFTWREQEEFIIARSAESGGKTRRLKWDLILGAISVTLAIFMLGWQADKIISIQASVAFIIFYAVLYRYGN